MRYINADAGPVIKATDTVYKLADGFLAVIFIPSVVAALLATGAFAMISGALWAAFLFVPGLIYLTLFVCYRKNSVLSGDFFSSDEVVEKAQKSYNRIPPGLPRDLATDLMKNILLHAEQGHSLYGCGKCEARSSRIAQLVPVNQALEHDGDIKAVDNHLQIMRELS